jgi:N4-gp56 family major capsid protein
MVADIQSALDSTATLVEGVPPAFVDLAIDIDKFSGCEYGKVVSVSSLADWESPFSLANTAAEKITRWGAEVWNLIARQAYMQCTNVVYSNGASSKATTSGKMTATDLSIAAGRLRMFNVPKFPDQNYVAILSPRQIVDLQGDTAPNCWANAVRYSMPETLLAGEVGVLSGCRIVDGGSIAQSEATAGASSVDVLTAVITGPEAIGLGDIGSLTVAAVTSPDHSDPLAQNLLFGVRFWGGAGYLGKAGDKACLLKTAGTVLASGQA